MPAPEAQAGQGTAHEALTRVFLTRLSLVDFRNYAAVRLSLGPEPVVLVGRNGSGKTNLLEAVSILSPGRGLRRARYEDMLRKDSRADAAGAAPGWAVSAAVARANGDGGGEPRTVGTGFSPAEARGRRIRIDGADAPAEDLLSILKVLWLTPAMDGLFTGPEADRRRFVDRLTLALFADHGRHASAFETAMRQRNRLLEDGWRDAAWLDAVEAELARHGAAIATRRAAMVGRLSHALAAAPADADFPRPRLALAGDLEALLDDAGEALEPRLAAAYRAGRGRDEAAGRTLLGPHRTGVVVTHADKEMPAALASTGEQKALLISLVVAHAELAARAGGEAPVLLLDEVAAHLDAHRRAALFDRLERMGAQTFMTGTDRHLFEAIEDRARIFTVADGALAP